MKKIAVYLLALGATPAFCQQWFSAFYDPFNGAQEKAVDFNVSGNLCYIRSNAICASGATICSELGLYSLSANQLTQAEQFNQVQAGFSVIVEDENLILSSEESLIEDIVVKDNYIPIVSHLNEWVIDYTFPTFPSKVRRYRFSPDSVLTAGKYYHELIYSESMSGGPWETSGAFFREENGRVFKIGGVLGDPERLIYNFNFSIGDSLQGNPGIGQATRHVTQTDIIHLLDGMPRKRLVLNSLCGESEWIEGMGDMNQLFESEIFCSLAGDMTEFTVRCFNTDGQLVYKRADLDDCYTSSTEEAVLQAKWVYPNPVSDLIFLSTDHIGTVEKVVLFNNIGQKVLIVENWRELTSAIDVSGLEPGFYLGVANISGFGRRVFKFVKV